MANERIENLKTSDSNRVDETKIGEPFFTGPTEFLVQETCRQLKAIPQWTKIFGENIDPYRRMDYSMRMLPVLRVYNEETRKEFESWFIEGDLKADIILPAVLRRNELQQVQDTLSMALLQQFRRPTFFDVMCSRVPGLNELGKRFSVDKSLGFEWEEALVPLTQITINFRLDLRIWDDYLEETDRTKDSPFERVLGDLERISSTIEGLKEGSTEAETEIGIEQSTTGD